MLSVNFRSILLYHYIYIFMKFYKNVVDDMSGTIMIAFRHFDCFLLICVISFLYTP